MNIKSINPLKRYPHNIESCAFILEIFVIIFLTVSYYHVTYAFQCESNLYSYLNVKELVAQNRRDIWSLSDSNEIQTHNQLVFKQTLNHLAKWLSICLRTTWLWVRILLLPLTIFLFLMNSFIYFGICSTLRLSE